MPKRLKLKPAKVGADDKQLTQAVLDSAHQIWLAGLGAFSKAQAEGAKTFETLIEQGREIESRTRAAAEAKVEEMKRNATGTWDKLETVFEQRVSRSLNKLGVPTHADIVALQARIDELNSAVKSLARK